LGESSRRPGIGINSMAASTPGIETDNSERLVQNVREGPFVQRASRMPERWVALLGRSRHSGPLMGLKRFLLVGLLVICIAAAAVLLFLAGDHDEEYRNNAQAPRAHASSAY